MKVLRHERERLELSRAEMARRAQLNAATYGQIESGRLVPYAPQLKRICKALGWPTARGDELLEECAG